jgi:hypothetical protein
VDAVDALFEKAKALGEAAADDAKSRGPVDGEVSERISAEYFERVEPELRKVVASLAAKERAQLPEDGELYELLANEYFEAWEARAWG